MNSQSDYLALFRRTLAKSLLRKRARWSDTVYTKPGLTWSKPRVDIAASESIYCTHPILSPGGIGRPLLCFHKSTVYLLIPCNFCDRLRSIQLIPYEAYYKYNYLRTLSSVHFLFSMQQQLHVIFFNMFSASEIILMFKLRCKHSCRFIATKLIIFRYLWKNFFWEVQCTYTSTKSKFHSSWKTINTRFRKTRPIYNIIIVLIEVHHYMYYA